MDMFLEANRLKTFKNWPYTDGHSCNAQNVAEAGFYFVGDKNSPDLVRCFLCNKTLENWEVDDDPMQEHKSHTTNCAFAITGKSEKDLTLKELFAIKALFTRQLLQKEVDQLEELLENLKTSKKTTKRKIVKKEKH